jgi:hypothetical protein
MWEDRDMDINPNETDLSETDTAPLKGVEPDFDFDEEDEDIMRELLAEGYSIAEARRMIGGADYDDDDYGYGDDDLDRDVPDEEFE